MTTIVHLILLKIKGENWQVQKMFFFEIYVAETAATAAKGVVTLLLMKFI